MGLSAKLPNYLSCLILLCASGCTFLSPSPTSTPTPSPTPSPLPTPIRWPTPTPEPPDTGWQQVQTGIERRRLLIATDKDTPETAKEYLSVVRLDPMQVRFRVHYNPSQPLRISGWAARLQTLLVVNGGYFTPEYETTNLLISDGETWGVIPGNYAGFFAVTADGQADVRWLQDHPYDPTESVEQGLMSFPVLIKTGGEMGFPAEADNGMHARRTVVAQDTTGQILFIVVPQDTFSLHEMAVFLAECDMEIDVALNLDGGPSTGLWLQSEAHPINIDSRAAIPSVISIEAR